MINDLFNIMLPQICMGVFILINLLSAMFISPKHYGYARLISLTGISLSIVLLSTVQTEPQYFGFRNSVMSDSYTLLFSFVILTCGFFIALLTKNLLFKIKQNAFTFQALLLTAILGAINVVSANDFLTLFVSIEMLSFPTYFLIASAKGYHSKEAAFKYLITSAVSTGVFLFGVSYLYGITSTLNFMTIYKFVSDNDISLLYSFACVMTITGLISKLAIFPFANWVIDVYKGCESSVLAFLSTIPALALFGIVCRLFVFPLSSSFELVFATALFAIITAFWANTYAIREKNVKAIFACSSASNTAYMLLVASLVSVYNLSTVIFYLICYVILNITVFGFLNMTECNNIGNNLEDFSGLFKYNHGLTVAYAIAILGLAGLPITSGFVAKIYLFTAIANSGLIFVPFLLILLLLMVFALFYYLKLILPLFETNQPDDNKLVLKTVYSQKVVVLICTLITIIVGIYPEILIRLCKFIAYNI
ncbi:MAG: NADH-quinone oxidoreductase subunit N [bacterium]|nr:NADH-quinone oxidoreductase subunit N [bacterium]